MSATAAAAAAAARLLSLRTTTRTTLTARSTSCWSQSRSSSRLVAPLVSSSSMATATVTTTAKAFSSSSSSLAMTNSQSLTTRSRTTTTTTRTCPNNPSTLLSSLPSMSYSSRRWNSVNAAAAAAAAAASNASTNSTANLINQDAFPSLLITAHQDIEAAGTFAKSQAMYLQPDPTAVQEIYHAIQQAKVGIVAHYYMDVELQGVLQAVGDLLAADAEKNHKNNISSQPPPCRLVGVADSLKMGDMAVDMCRDYPNDVQAIICLGVDFMSESVQAILQKQGYGHVPVYRLAQAKIGCSLAESAEHDSYRAWLQKESQDAAALHVVYINTSLETKAVCSSLVPTITCTSSNVLATLLQAHLQLSPLTKTNSTSSTESSSYKILYGPDTYMGENLVTLLSTIVDHWDDARVQKELHPAHTVASVRELRNAIRVYPAGNCVVHHMFGAAVVDTVQRHYPTAFVTAHLEVPGEMFQIAMQASMHGKGVVGSTSDILNFITKKVKEAAESTSSTSTSSPIRLQFILGTEAGMVTSIVKNVKAILQQQQNKKNTIPIETEIIFPVSQDAVAAGDDAAVLPVIPGVRGGEGCSTAGGCATCPFMKMNSLDALQDVLQLVATTTTSAKTNQDSAAAAAKTKLSKHLPPDRLSGKFIHGRPAVELGSEAILYMREFMKNKKLPDELVQKVLKQGKP